MTQPDPGDLVYLGDCLPNVKFYGVVGVPIEINGVTIWLESADYARQLRDALIGLTLEGKI